MTSDNVVPIKGQEIKIKNEMRVNQMKMLDIYIEAAESDTTLKVFLQNMHDRLGAFLNVD